MMRNLTVPGKMFTTRTVLLTRPGISLLVTTTMMVILVTRTDVNGIRYVVHSLLLQRIGLHCVLRDTDVSQKSKVANIVFIALVLDCIVLNCMSLYFVQLILYHC